MKPISKERRAEIQERLDMAYDSLVADLLDAEAYWREAVKKADESSDAGPSSGMCYRCNFCNEYDAPISSVSGDGIIVHKPDCPWLLAQEET